MSGLYLPVDSELETPGLKLSLPSLSAIDRITFFFISANWNALYYFPLSKPSEGLYI